MRKFGGLFAIMSLIGATSYAPSDATCLKSIQGRFWGPIRIGVHYIDEDQMMRDHGHLADLVKAEVMPRLTKFWFDSMLVRRVKGNLHVRRDCVRVSGFCTAVKQSICSSLGGSAIPIPLHLLGDLELKKVGSYGRPERVTIQANTGEDVDFVLLVTMDDNADCSDGAHGGTIASAFSCRFDECNRPLLGSVNICPRAVDPTSASSITSLYSTLAHEMTHAFGFNADTYDQFRYTNGLARIPDETKKTTYYTCRIVGGLPRVQWDVSMLTPGSRPYSFPTGIVSEISARGVGSQCRCPMDPSRRYSSADIEHCLANKHECLFAITTPMVAAMAKAYLGCDGVKGAELENQESSPSCQILPSHLKERLFGDEYMTSFQSQSHDFISPVTFALLEDSGWYRMNYFMTTALIPGAMWGYKAGCPFSTDKCLTDSTGLAVKTDFSSKTFCSANSPSNILKCSANALSRAACSIDHSGNVPQPYALVANSRYKRFDFCPVYADMGIGCAVPPESGGYSRDEIHGSSSRCIDTSFHGTEPGASCYEIECRSNGSKYLIKLSDGRTSGSHCESDGQVISFGGIRFTCRDPQVICSKHDYPHLNVNPVADVSGSIENNASRIEAKQVVDSLAYDYNAFPYASPSGSEAIIQVYFALALILCCLTEQVLTD